jgi:apolipoprotein N-acyltransferase
VDLLRVPSRFWTRDENQFVAVAFAPGAEILFTQFDEKNRAIVIAVPGHRRNSFLPGIDFNERTEAFWRRTFQTLQDSGKTILFGASVSNGNGGRFNTVIIRGAESQLFRQRIPVPIAMWKPYRDDGVPLDMNGPSIVKVTGRRITILICYEQLLIWPALTSFAHHPTIVVGVANDYWAGATTIPKVQHACLASWSRLFHVPLVWSENT